MYVPPENVVVKLPKLISVGTMPASVGVYVKSVMSGVVGVAHVLAVGKPPPVATAPPATELLPPTPPALVLATSDVPAAPPAVPVVPPAVPVVPGHCRTPREMPPPFRISP